MNSIFVYEDMVKINDTVAVLIPEQQPTLESIELDNVIEQYKTQNRSKTVKRKPKRFKRFFRRCVS